MHSCVTHMKATGASETRMRMAKSSHARSARYQAALQQCLVMPSPSDPHMCGGATKYATTPPLLSCTRVSWLVPCPMTTNSLILTPSITHTNKEDQPNVHEHQDERATADENWDFRHI